ncbi:hypothetical protein GCM10010417_10660 [Streptomyces carpaticus]
MPYLHQRLVAGRNGILDIGEPDGAGLAVFDHKGAHGGDSSLRGCAGTPGAAVGGGRACRTAACPKPSCTAGAATSPVSVDRLTICAGAARAARVPGRGRVPDRPGPAVVTGRGDRVRAMAG